MNFRYTSEDCTQIEHGFVEKGVLMNDPLTQPNLLPCQPVSGNDWHELQIRISLSKKVMAYLDGKVMGSFIAKFSTRGFGGVLAANGFNTVAEFRNFDVAPIISNSLGNSHFYTKFRIID